MRWINTKDQLPEIDKRVIVCYKGGGIMISKYVKYGKKHYWWDDDEAVSSIDLVTHWMPLPQPPAVSIPQCEIKRKAEEYGLKTQELDGGGLAIDVNSGDFTGFISEIKGQSQPNQTEK